MLRYINYDNLLTYYWLQNLGLVVSLVSLVLNLIWNRNLSVTLCWLDIGFKPAFGFKLRFRTLVLTKDEVTSTHTSLSISTSLCVSTSAVVVIMRLAYSKVKYTWICIACLCKRLWRAQIWITQHYLQTTPYLPLLPVAEHHRPLTGTHCTYPWLDGQAELTWVVG